MAVPSLLGTAIGVTNVAFNATIGPPTGVQSGEWLLAVVGGRHGGTGNFLSGENIVLDDNVGSDDFVLILESFTGSNQRKTWVFLKAASANDIAGTSQYVIGLGTSDQFSNGHAYIMRLDAEVAAHASNWKLYNGTSTTLPSVTTTVADCLMLVAQQGSESSAFIDAEDHGAPWTKFIDGQDYLGLHEQDAASTGSYGGESVSWSFHSGRLMIVALAPVGGAGPNEGTATGSIAWVGSATGSTVKAGSATGSVAWVGTATGTSAPSGSATGAIAWAGTATGTATKSGSAAGAIAWSGTSTGTATYQGSASGSIAWVGSATGEAPATVPDAVDDLAGTAGDTQVTLTWTAPADGGAAITDYIVQYRLVPA